MVSAAARKNKKPTRVAANAPASKLGPAPSRRIAYIAAAVVLVVVAACYANALANGFVFDDHGHVLDNRALRSLANLPQILNDYRPIRDLSYAVDFAVWGEKPLGFHLTSVLIHLANALLVFTLILRLTKATAIAGFAALVFAIHPIQPDAVTYISGRRDVLFALFYLASFHFYLSYRRESAKPDASPGHRRRAYLHFALFALCWALSLMSKEMAASLPLVIFAWNFCDVWDSNNQSRLRQVFAAGRNAFSRDKWLYVLLAAGALAVTYYYVVIEQASSRASVRGFNYWGGSFFTNFLTAMHVHGWYLKQLVFPTPIVQYSGAFPIATTPFDWRVILSIVAVCSTIAAGFLLLNRNKLMSFAIFSYFAMLVPVSQIIPHHELLADHYLYLPLASFGLFASLMVSELASKGQAFKRTAWAAAAAALIAFAALTPLRNTVYKDDLSLWKANYNEVPDSARAISSLAGQYATSYPGKAAELYKQCTKADPSYAPAYVSLAALYQTKEKAREADQIIQSGLALPDSKVISPGYDNPNRFRSELTTGLAIAKGFEGLQGEVEALLLKAIELYPSNSQPYTLLANYYHTADRDKEIEFLKRQIATFPNDPYPLQTLSKRYVEAKRYDDAMPYLQTMLAMDPNDFFTNYELGQIYRTKKDCVRAGQHLTAAKPGAASDDDKKAIDEALTGYQRECGGS